jgi:4-amino-4-deoxy-L-arabinose transferase-like glycosyltransferase
LLLPFAGKPLHIDDPMYVWTAQHILKHPLDFYGQSVNWQGAIESMATAQQNPPGVAYWLALVGALFGWSEPALHTGMLVPAVLAVIGVWLLARRLGAPPALAALCLLAMPGFLVSSTTVMADVPAIAFWIWAVLAWVTGVEQRRTGYLVAGALLSGLCIVTKFVGLALIPLLLAYTVAKSRRLERRCLFLLVPLAIALAYRAFMLSLYGVDPFAAASAFSHFARERAGSLGELPWIGLIFLGGTCLPTLFLAGWIFSRRVCVLFLASLPIVIAALLWANTLADTPLRPPEGIRWGLVLQLALFTLSGALVFPLALQHVWRHRSAEAVLLALWVGGIFVFGSLLNWTTNVRALLPAAPAVAILLAAEAKVLHPRAFGISPGLFAALGICLLAGLLVAQGDEALALSARRAASQIAQAHRRGGQRLWYQGAWGFQYYMDQEGAKKLDWRHTEAVPGDEMALGSANTVGLFPLPAPIVSTVADYRFPLPALASTQSSENGAGFYSDVFGPAPYVFGIPPDEIYYVQLFQARFFVRKRVKGVDASR